MEAATASDNVIRAGLFDGTIFESKTEGGNTEATQTLREHYGQRPVKRPEE